MSLNQIIEFVARWGHLWAAMTLIGGAIFLRQAVLPTAATLEESVRETLMTGLRNRWRKVVMAGIGILLLTGLFNYVGLNLLPGATPRHKGDGLYHALMGIKILIGFAAFFLASVLAGRSPKFEGLRQQGAKWYGVLITLSLLAMTIGSFLKVRG